MKFGKLTDLSHVDWAIPEDDSLSKEILASVNSSPDQLKVFFGAPAWGHPAWVGKIYPVGTKRADYLSYYARYFNCIELNTTHYRIPSIEQIQKWVAQVPSDFVFCPKIFQGISHAKNGLMDIGVLRSWVDSIAQFGNHLGPCFLQLPPHFDYSLKGELFVFLQNWPDQFPLAIEFRHPSWFKDRKILTPLTRYLQSRGIGLVITDVAGRRDVLHASISTNFALIRFVGNDLHFTDFDRAKRWSERIVEWSRYGLKQLFLFIHEPDDVSVPEMTEIFLKELSQRGSWKFSSPPKADGQLGLFNK